ncbi:MAG: sulfite exporter TauE/SafE family protein [Nocardioidaceae bacterium]
MALTDLTPAAWALLAAGAVLVGIAKTAISGVGSVAVVLFALAVPAKESTGALLPLLICGDLLAMTIYRRHADWRVLARLLPGVIPGLALGTWFLATASNDVVRPAIGVALLAMSAMQLWQRRGRAKDAVPAGPARVHLVTAAVLGGVAGFVTMTANAAGPVMTIYLILAGLPMLRMLGTGAWFFLLVNLLKVPFSTSLHLINPGSLAVDAALVPALLVGAVLGRQLIRRINQHQFEMTALGVSMVASALLFI